MSGASARARRRRLGRGRGWPFCEHCGSQRITGTAAELVVSARRYLGPDSAGLVRGITMLAAETGPEDELGICPSCTCIAAQDRPHH